MQVEDIWDETERVRPLVDGMEKPMMFSDSSDKAESEDSSAPLHFDLSDPDQIRQYFENPSTDFYQSFGFMTSNIPEYFWKK